MLTWLRRFRGRRTAARVAAGQRDPFARYTTRARRVLVFAQDEAQRLDHNYLGTEHLLLGLLREGEGCAARALGDLGLTLTEARRLVELSTGRGEQARPGPLPLTPQAKLALGRAVAEARALGHHYLGTEHLLLALSGDGSCAGALLRRQGIPPTRLRQAVLTLLSEYRA